MNKIDLAQYAVESIHYPSWSDTFDWRMNVLDCGTSYKVGPYILEKNIIRDMETSNNRIILTMFDGRKVSLVVQAKA